MKAAILLCKGLVTVTCAMALASSAVAQDSDFARLTGLQIIGVWTEGERYGDIRLLSQQEGYETVRNLLSVDWTYIDPQSGTAEVVATQVLTDCAGLPVSNFSVKTLAQSSFDQPLSASLSDGAVVLDLQIAAPGTITLTGC